ncbi:hypothetical protein [Paenibacillus wynnii]|uniref:hypothetical protein n=1 Tax=Paenibacillus wynnii TaxID=268407 RepID=UPI00279353AC|nr:hypothetical protein [Paenibacillus wynnii]MDQ0194943.1 hypothetical protein [Paenibacillus wynnii]
MRKRVYVILTGLMMIVCSLVLISCDAITAQKITNTGSGSFPGMNGGGRNGAPGMNGRQGMDRATRNSNGNSMRGMMNADLTGKILTLDGNTVTVELVDTGEQKTLTISTDSTVKTSDLKEGQIIIVWYKENTETVERITVMNAGQ